MLAWSLGSRNLCPKKCGLGYHEEERRGFGGYSRLTQAREKGFSLPGFQVASFVSAWVISRRRLAIGDMLDGQRQSRLAVFPVMV